MKNPVWSPVDVDVSCLTDAMAAVLSLGVHGRVPVTVVEDHSVGAGQVHPDPPAASRQDEAEDATVCVEALHEGLEEEEEEEHIHPQRSSQLPFVARVEA